VWLHESNYDCATFQLPNLLNCERLHSYDDIRDLENRRAIICPFHILIKCIRKPGPLPGATLHHDPDSRLSQLSDDFGHQGDTSFVRCALTKRTDCDGHAGSLDEGGVASRPQGSLILI
jgi:hypothetical protein